MKIKWKKRRFFSLFFMLEALNPWWRAKEILRANSGRLFLDRRPKISQNSSKLIKTRKRRTFARKERVKVKSVALA